MGIVIVIGLAVAYFGTCGKLIRWAAERADQNVPSWWDIVGMLLWPVLLGRLVRWAIPDSWHWPETWIGLGVWTATLLGVLIGYFKLPARYAAPMCVVIFVVAILTAMEMLDYVPAKS